MKARVSKKLSWKSISNYRQLFDHEGWSTTKVLVKAEPSTMAHNPTSTWLGVQLFLKHKSDHAILGDHNKMSHNLFVSKNHNICKVQ